jgi:hypothetical protein
MIPNIRWFPITALKGLKSQDGLVAVVLCCYPTKVVELGYWTGKRFVNQNKNPFKTKFTHFAVLELPSEPSQDNE